MKYRTTDRLLGASLLVALTLMTVSCNDTFIDPFESQDRYYSVYGYLNILDEEHAVRVIPIRRFPARIESPSDAQATINATVSSTDLQTGVTTLWSHSLEELDDGNLGHIFRASFSVKPGHTYRLDILRSDGTTTSAETTVPAVPDFAPQFDAAQPDANGKYTQELVLADFPSVWDAIVIYRMRFIQLTNAVRVPYGRLGPAKDGVRHLTINLSDDVPAVRQFISQAYNYDGPLFLLSMGLQVQVLDGNWDLPQGEIDPELFAQPGIMSNVENGYGFWGSIAVYEQDWNVGPELTRMLGFDIDAAME